MNNQVCVSVSETTLYGHNLSGPIGCVYIGKLQSHSVFFLSCGVLLGTPARGGLLPLPSSGRGQLVSGAECGSLQPFWDRGVSSYLLKGML